MKTVYLMAGFQKFNMKTAYLMAGFYWFNMKTAYLMAGQQMIKTIRYYRFD